ncbi:hypothetical protein [Proteus mirabilis]|uniref:hypothetical protein n=1 Tax=Proteus mirabilis TaxID=584 RepID=UPI0034D66E08
MELTGTKAQESGYVVTSLTSQQQNTICEPNSSDALSYVGSNKLVNALCLKFLIKRYILIFVQIVIFPQIDTRAVSM